jgi:hypothetical protein
MLHFKFWHTSSIDFSHIHKSAALSYVYNAERILFPDKWDTYLYDEFDVVYRLRVIYGDGNHFVARLFTKDGQIWYHDGITTGSNCHFEGNLDKLPDSAWLKTAS